VAEEYVTTFHPMAAPLTGEETKTKTLLASVYNMADSLNPDKGVKYFICYQGV